MSRGWSPSLFLCYNQVLWCMKIWTSESSKRIIILLPQWVPHKLSHAWQSNNKTMICLAFLWHNCNNWESFDHIVWVVKAPLSKLDEFVSTDFSCIVSSQGICQRRHQVILDRATYYKTQPWCDISLFKMLVNMTFGFFSKKKNMTFGLF